MKSTVLVTGASGLLGRQVVKEFQKAGWNVVGTGLSRANPPSILKVDLCNAAELESVLDDVKPNVVVHSTEDKGAAQRFPDLVDANPDAARSLNINATRSLAQLISARSCLLVYISTDYVFPGTPGDAPYSSSSKPGPPNLYGQTKLDGETAVLEVTKENGLGVVLRVPVLYGPVEKDKGNKESAVNVLLDAVNKAQKEKVVMDDWSIRYPTNTEDVGRVCADLSTKLLEAGGEAERKAMGRIFQFSSEDRFTKYEICELIAEILGLPLPHMVANKEGNDPNASVQRPYDCHLSTKALVDLGIDVQTQDFRAWWRWQVGAYRH